MYEHIAQTTKSVGTIMSTILTNTPETTKAVLNGAFTVKTLVAERRHKNYAWDGYKKVESNG